MFAKKIGIIVLSFVGLVVPQLHLFAETTEWKMNLNILPPYCKERAQAGAAGLKAPSRYAVLKDVWVHLHHYCAGIYAEYKAKGTIDKRERETWLAEVIGQMAYVGRQCNSRCALFPELHTRWGWALAKTGQAGEAVNHYRLVINSKPKYSPAYWRLSELYLELNKPEEARKILEEGGRANPKSKMLRKKLEEIGAGKS